MKSSKRHCCAINNALRLAVLSSVFTCAFIASSHADIFEFLITLDGSQLVPPVDTEASGTGTVRLDTDTNELNWNITFAGLSSEQFAAHFHGPAGLCQNGGIQITLPLGSPIIGSAFLTDQQEQDVIAQLWYVNIHTKSHPSGEIRGQLMHMPIDDPIPAPVPQGQTIIRLREIATGLTAPNWGMNRPGHPEFLMVTDQQGILWDINKSTGAKRVFLDVSSRLVPLGVGGKGTFDERGLLGIAFHPEYLNNGLLYTYTSEPINGPADFSTMPKGEPADHQAVIAEWHVPDPSDPESTVDPKSVRVLLKNDEPQFNHDGGGVNFGPDGMLYISFGDGGNRDDEGVGHECRGNGQDATNVLGTVLRIDPLGNNSTNGQYGIPEDNPFVGVDEIFAFGFRNPFRFSFDTMTGDLLLADVGQGDLEEVDIVISGGNYGWSMKEGSFFFVPNGASRGYATNVNPGVPKDLIDPIAEYDHDEGIAIIGGFVYRGSRIPSLEGKYVFGDWNMDFFGDNGRVFYLDSENNVVEFQLDGQAGLGMSLLGFGQDAEGELYVLANLGGIPFGKSGVVLKVERGLPLALSNLDVVTGTLLDGDVTNLSDSDNSFVHTRSGFGFTLSELHKMELRVTATASGSPNTIDLLIEHRIDEPIGSVRVLLRNWNTDNFDSVASDSIGTSDQLLPVFGIDATNYINKAGQIEVAVKHIVFVPFLAFTFDSLIDQVQVFTD